MTLKGAFGDPVTEKDIASAKRINLIALLVLMAMFVMAAIFYYQLQEKKQELERKTLELADSTARLNRMRGELVAAQEKLSQREHNVEQQLQALSSSVEQKDYTQAAALANTISVQMAEKKAKPKLWVNFYSWQPNSSAQSKAQDFLRKEDITIVKDQTFEEKPNWMAASSAVYFFDEGGQKMAQGIASKLSKLCGTPFAVERGDPSDVLPGRDYSWLNIHYIGAQEAKAQ